MLYPSIANDNVFFGAFGAFVEYIHEVYTRRPEACDIESRDYIGVDINGIRAAAAYFNGDWQALWQEYPAEGDAIISWVDQSGEKYLERLTVLKGIFHNFNY